VDYLERNSSPEVLAPTGLNLLHLVDAEPALDPAQPLLGQRRHAKFVSRMCKPAIKRVPVRWASGTHGVDQPFDVRNDLFLFHAKYADYDMAMRVHDGRHHEFVTRGSGSRAAWRLDRDELAGRYASWVRPETRMPVDVDLAALDVSSVVRKQPNGAYVTVGGQLMSMDTQALLRLPDYIGAPV
jgi:hypothetical protein